MKTLAVDNPVDTSISHHTIDDHKLTQSVANLSTQTRYKVCSNGFAYITTPTTSIFKQLVLASMMWFVSIRLFQVAQTSYYKIISTCQLVKTSLLSTSLLQFCKRTSLLQLVHNLLQSCQASILSTRCEIFTRDISRFETSRISTDSNRSVADGHQLVPSFLTTAQS